MGRRVRAVLTAILAAFAVSLPAWPAYATRPDLGPRTGVDVSWPQCGRRLPVGFSFAVVGVNGGTATTTNPCLGEQLSWALESTTGLDPAQPRVQLYVNTGNPGEVLEEYAVTTWPTDNVDGRGHDSSGLVVAARRNPYGACTTTPGAFRGYTNDLACSWQYGWNRAVEVVDERFGPAARAAGASDSAADYAWWLDVETMNSWQEDGSEAQARNAAVLEGMAQLYLAEGVQTVGLYSTRFQWHRILGDALRARGGSRPEVGANLLGLPTWLAGASNAEDAELRCATAEGLTGGPVVLVQHIVDDLDHNLSCV